MPSLPAAVLFDLDGTLVDTEPYWIEVEMALAERDGGTWSHADALELIGSDLRYSAQILRERAGIKGTDQEIIDDLVAGVAQRNATHGIRWRPGARELLDALHAEGVPCAIVTMSYRVLAESVAALLPEGMIATIVGGDEVEQGKPHPEPYLRAAERLGVDITRCIGVEDSPKGIAAVEASGARAIGVPFLLHLHRTPGRNRVESLAQLTLDDLRSIVDGHVIDLLELP